MYTKKKKNNKKQKQKTTTTTKITLQISKDQTSNEGKNKIHKTNCKNFKNLITEK